MKFAIYPCVVPMVAAWVIPGPEQLSAFQQLRFNPKSAGQSSSSEAVISILDRTTSYPAELFDNIGNSIKSTLDGKAISVTTIEKEEEEDDDDDDAGDDEDIPLPDLSGKKYNLTTYEIIQASKQASIFAKLISEFDDIVKDLNSTDKNHTVFVPSDTAFEKFKHHPDVSKELKKKFVQYHLSPDVFPVQKIFSTRTVPTDLKPSELGEYRQRISTQFGLRGLSLNFYAHVIKGNVYSTNGIVHGIDHILIPPLLASDTLNFLSLYFSQFEFGLAKTGLYDAINDTTTHSGGTIFAPTNFAFEKLGPKVNGFLFSRWGEKYLKALLEYHLVANRTLYSDAYNEPKDESSVSEAYGRTTHIDLPTLLKDHQLSIDIAHVSRFVSIKINGFVSVHTPDVPTKDGVIHVINDVLIPPEKPHSAQKRSCGKNEKKPYMGSFSSLEKENKEESSYISIEELIERLEPYVE